MIRPIPLNGGVSLHPTSGEARIIPVSPKNLPDMPPRALLWLRRDLRLDDRPALETAGERFATLLLVAIDEEDDSAPRKRRRRRTPAEEGAS
jgi:hypothetical protein